MNRVHIFCEGQTEDVFVREILGPYFQLKNIWVNPIIIRTGRQGKGGVTSYGKIRWQIEHKCKEDSSAWVTTLFDFYGLPTDFPQMDSVGDSITRAKAVEQAFQRDIAQPNFLANLVVHEFEGLLFSDPLAFASWFDGPELVGELIKIREEFSTPEHINDGRATAPSKRILALFDGYDKVLHGTILAMDIGLDRIRKECPIFDNWLKQLESLVLDDKD